MDRLQDKYAIQLDWRAFELRPPGSPPMPAAYRARIDAARPQLIERARAEYGLELNIGPFGIDSRPALIGEMYAKHVGLGEAYHDRVFDAYWLEAADIGDLNILADLAAKAGLDRAAFLAALEDKTYLQAMLADVAQAHAYGLNAVPAMVFDDKYLIVGAQPYTLLEQAVQHCEAERAAEA